MKKNSFYYFYKENYEKMRKKAIWFKNSHPELNMEFEDIISEMFLKYEIIKRNYKPELNPNFDAFFWKNINFHLLNLLRFQNNNKNKVMTKSLPLLEFDFVVNKLQNINDEEINKEVTGFLTQTEQKIYELVNIGRDFQEIQEILKLKKRDLKELGMKIKKKLYDV